MIPSYSLILFLLYGKPQMQLLHPKVNYTSSCHWITPWKSLFGGSHISPRDIQSNQSSDNCGSCFSVPSWHPQVTHRRSPIASPVLIETVNNRVLLKIPTHVSFSDFCVTISIFGVSFFLKNRKWSSHKLLAHCLPGAWVNSEESGLKTGTVKWNSWK